MSNFEKILANKTSMTPDEFRLLKGRISRGLLFSLLSEVQFTLGNEILDKYGLYFKNLTPKTKLMEWDLRNVFSAYEKDCGVRADALTSDMDKYAPLFNNILSGRYSEAISMINDLQKN